MSEGHQEIQLTMDESKAVPFAEHVYELRRRLFYIAVFVAAGTIAAYAVQKKLVAALLKPAHGQHFIYTSPAGGIDFLFRVCLYAGIALGIPVIVYQLLRYLEPVFPKQSYRFVFWGTAVSGLLALMGVCFGYFIGLPHAMNFLLNQSVTTQIQPLLAIQSYMSFVIRYMLGSALMFQLPLILIFINRIKPLRPRKLFRLNRWVILVAFVISGLMNPTPRIYDQLLIAGPLILMYQISIAIIAFVNRAPKSVAQPVPSQVLKLPVVDEPAVALNNPQIVQPIGLIGGLGGAMSPTAMQLDPRFRVAAVTAQPTQAKPKPARTHLLSGQQRLISDFFVVSKAST